LSPVEVTEAHLDRIASLNPELFAFITVTAEQAMDAARSAEEEISAGQWRGPMHGIPFGVKDIVDTAGILTTNGSSFHRENVPDDDAEIIRRLKTAGGVMLGKTHTHEFAAAATTINPHYGTTRNPWDRGRIVGG
jgi:aspartyl-tRNA(Asn)/glutamyl-tRNA(Gln) amidotransferase subunit A